jgi:hypothetical protein
MTMAKLPDHDGSTGRRKAEEGRDDTCAGHAANGFLTATSRSIPGAIKRASGLLLQYCGTEFVETKQLKDPLAVEIEYPQVVCFVQIALDRVEMPAIALLREIKRHIEGDKLADSLGFEPA